MYFDKKLIPLLLEISAEDPVPGEECPDCGAPIYEDEEGFFCKECGWESSDDDSDE